MYSYKEDISIYLSMLQAETSLNLLISLYSE